MKNSQNNRLTYILLIIAGVICLINGVLAFDHSIIMISLSLLFMIIGIGVLYFSILGLKNEIKKPNNKARYNK